MTEPSVLPQPRRTRPWDTGPEATARDVAALRFVGEQYTARLDVLAVALGRLSPGVLRDADRLGDRTVRQRVERWEAAGWAERRRMLGHTWVLATRGGLRLAGLDLDPWTPALDRLAHHHAAAVVRLHREAVPGQGRWVCERELWRRRGRQHRCYPTRPETPTPPAVPPVALHLLHGWWVASCPDCGHELGRSRDQETAERAGERRRCPICRPERPDRHAQLAFLVAWLTANGLDHQQRRADGRL